MGRGIARTGMAMMLVLSMAAAALADRADEIERVMDALRVDETIDIMRDEGIIYGAEIAKEMLPEAGGPAWQATIKRIYDSEKMQRLVAEGFRRELADTDLTAMLLYLESDEGREIVQLELEARRVFLDPEVADTASERYETLVQQDAPLVDMIDTLVRDGDLVERNVMGTLNSSLKYYHGLADGGAVDMTESEILSDVWSQEEDARRDSRDWLGAFLAMAYQPLQADKLERYAVFYRTPAGRDLNRVIFAAFDPMYEETSYLMGLAVAEHLASEPL